MRGLILFAICAVTLTLSSCHSNLGYGHSTHKNPMKKSANGNMLHYKK